MMMGFKTETSVEECTLLMSQCFNKFRHDIDHEKPPLKFGGHDFMSLYDSVHTLCSDGSHSDTLAALLYDAFLDLFHVYLSTEVAPALLKLGDDRDFLRELDRRWRDHLYMVTKLSAQVSYVDRCYLKRRTLPGLVEAGKACFRADVFEAVKGRATGVILGMLEQGREETMGETEADAMLAKTVATGVFMEVGTGGLDCYKMDFEEAVLEQTGKYYSDCAARWMETGTVSDYMFKAEAAIAKKREITRRYLNDKSEIPVVEAVRKALLFDHAERLLEDKVSGLRTMIRADDAAEDIKRIVRIYEGENLKQVAEVFQHHVDEEGSNILKRVKEGDVIRMLMELHQRHRTKLVRDCFDDREMFATALSAAFESVASKKHPRGTSLAELLADFCDAIFPTMIDEDSKEEILDNVVRMLERVHDKDAFMEFHREKLFRRQLFGKGEANCLDGSLTDKLTKRFGLPYTAKLKGMMADINLGEDFVEKFGDDTLLVTILTPNYWPSYKYSPDTAVVPTEMARLLQSYAEFYKAEFPNRNLTFDHSLGTCTVQARFDAKSIQLEVSTHQAAVLMLFEDKDGPIAYSDMKTELKMDDRELARVLDSLSSDKFEILKKIGDDGYEFNSGFESPVEEITMALRPEAMAEEEEEKKKVETEVDKDRRYAVDAALVRVMKRKGVMKYQEIIRECVEDCKGRFVAEVKMIKMRMDALIERDFMERDEHDSELFRYVA